MASRNRDIAYQGIIADTVLSDYTLISYAAYAALFSAFMIRYTLAYEKPDRQAWPAEVLGVEGTELSVKERPVN